MKTNYSKFMKKNHQMTKSEPQPEAVIEEVVDIPEETVEEEKKFGIVECEQLYLRKEANKESEPVTILKKNEELVIVSEDDPEWYEVCTASGQEGFCKKKFIKAK